jgi:hypothetical protein
LTGESDSDGPEDVDRLPTVNTDCSSTKYESASSMEENEVEKKRELATKGSDISVCFVEISAEVRSCLFMSLLPCSLTIYIYRSFVTWIG